jgi:2-keto-3-deoxy-6-phosphogluconate aldolase
MTAIGIVLVSSIVLGTTDAIKSVEFTRYSERFVHAIAVNMENRRLTREQAEASLQAGAQFLVSPGL